MAYNFSKNPVCTKCYTQTSKLEIRIFSEFKLFYPDTLWQEKIKNVEFDIYIPSKKIGIEVDGSNWHKDIKKDLKKNNFATDNGIFLFRIRTGNLPYIENSFQTDFKDDRVEVMIDMCDFLIKSKIHPTLFDFAKKWRKNNNNYLNGELFNELYFRLPSPPYEQSLQYANHELDKEWSEKNYPLKTNDIKPYSNTKYYWKCNESKHHPDYLMSPAKKMLGRGCPCCAGKELAHDNSLEYLKPIIAKRWNYKKNNNLKPNEVLAGSSKEYWFICENNHEWQDSLAHIKNNIDSKPCKQCKSLSFNFPGLVKEWDFLRNKLDIDYVHHGSNKSVYWKCSNCMHEYKNSISNMTRRGDKCPKCSYPNL